MKSNISPMIWPSEGRLVTVQYFSVPEPEHINISVVNRVINQMKNEKKKYMRIADCASMVPSNIQELRRSN